MAKMNKISSFKTFSELREAESADKLQQENKAKRLELTSKIGKVLDEMEITSFENLEEEVRDKLIEKAFGLVQEGDKAKVSKKEVKMHLDMFKSGDIDGDDLAQAISAIIFGEVKGPGMESKDAEQISEATVVMDAINPDDKDFLKFLKKNKVKVIDTVKSGPSGHPEITMQGKRKDLETVLSDSELGWDDPGLAEFIEESVNISEAVIVTGRRDAKKVLTAYTKFFQKYPVFADRRFAGLHLGAIKSLMVSALTDANFHRESAACGKAIKGAKLQPVYIKPIELNKTEIKVPVGKVSSILDDNASLISGAAGFSGLGIAEGTALYLDSLKYVKEAEAVIACFNSTFESEVTDVTEGNAFLGARAKAIEEDAEEFEFNGKKYPVIKESDKESITEAEVKSDEEFKEYATTVLQKAFGEDYDEAKANEVIDGILSKCGDDYGACVGTLTSSLSESVITEARFVKDFNKDVLDAKTKDEVLKLYPKAEFFIGKSDHFFGELDANLFFKAYYTEGQKEFKIKSIYSEKGSNYIHLYNESVVTEKTYNKKSLMKAMKADDGMIQLGNGQEYIIYAYGNGNDDNDDMWKDKTIFALDQDGEEHEINYSDIVSYNEANADGTISDDEDEKRAELINRVKEEMEELLASAEFDAEEIGGPFRSPGIMADIRKLLDKKVKKFR